MIAFLINKKTNYEKRNTQDKIPMSKKTESYMFRNERENSRSAPH